MGKRENKFQEKLIVELEEMFEGSIVTKLDANHIQGIPDLLILYQDRWAILECKRSEKAPHRPNQPYYVEKLNDMSYSSFIYPENKERVLDEIQTTLRNPKRKPRVSRSK